MTQLALYAGRYRLDRELGRGGMGVVHAGRDVLLDRDVAIKTMTLSARSDPAAVGRFQREARALASVHHPGIVTVHDYGEHDGELYLVMQLVEGGDLGQRLHGHRRLTPERTVDLADGVAAALDALHRAGLVHRDVKPSNILLGGAEERPVLGDFGLARRTEVADDLTGTGQAVGTVQCMSPEQLRGKPATAASDVYSFGCVLFHCLTGRPPFTGADADDVVRAHLDGPLPDARALVPALPGGVQPVLERCLAQDPGARWPSAGAAARALRDALTSHDTVVLPRTPVSASRVGDRPTRVQPVPQQPYDRQPYEQQPYEQQPYEGGRAERATSRQRSGGGLPRGLLAGCVALVLGAGAVGGVLGLTTGSSTTAPSPPPSGQGGGAAAVPLAGPEEQLASLLSDDYGDCAPMQRLPGQTAKLDCTRTPDGIASLHAISWEDGDAMDDWFRRTYVEPDAYAPQPCGTFSGGPQATGTGHVSTRAGGGDIACYVNANGHAVMLWQHDDREVTLLAIRDDADAAALFDWWEDQRDRVLRAG